MENASTKKGDAKKEQATKPSKDSGTASGSSTSTGGSREGNAGHAREQSGSQGRR